jgi:hypothetical protein
MDATAIQNAKSEREVTISKNDCKYIRDFFSVFTLNLPKPLQEAVDAFEKTEALEDQLKVKTELARFFITDEDPFIKDEFWDECRGNCQNILFHKEFDKQLAENLTKEQTTVTTM